MTRERRAGFSLLETIIVIGMVGVLAAIVVTMLGKQVSLSPRQIDWSRDEVSAQAIMEDVVADYVELINDDATRDAALSQLVSRNNADQYAPSGVVTMSYVSFPRAGGSETSSGSLLKVSVQEPGGITLTTILAPSRTEAADNAVNY
ncbi:type II secretion system protein [Pseudodesulfovibrio senegalensis]|jgi:prepilin-type N-terminal cleavage/methylation domain-containing protein|uniref:Type II secretion system protein n=1 Tax=Pseudodesulfovibrio senegalensis TaxID=1721087 RepID=A0A6N6N4C7_9BACT|nr:type II secretion system protein [Pseudodesulfovibrio senegalensis]KAB1441544.1 type II secretion system protein [Pseudodesulfovibrio senegalensis]